MDHRIADSVRFVADDEELDDLIDEAKADTWTKEREHALLVVQFRNERRFVFVRGGRDGILLNRKDEQLLIDVAGQQLQVLRLAWHVHPLVTGPSDNDRNVLDLLGQESSMLYEIGGPREGTLYGRMSDRKV